MADHNQPAGAAAQLLGLAYNGTTAVVRDTHAAIAGQVFGWLARIPLVAAPARIAESVHAAIAGGVYAGVESIGATVLDAADRLERSLLPDAAAALPMALKSPLNAAFGDHLQAHGNRLAIPMHLRHENGPLIVDAARLANSGFAVGTRICVLIHGLGCSEGSFQGASPRVHLGDELREAGFTPLYVRYNTGVPIAENGAQLSSLLDELLRAWPQAASELVLIGHSMGGLVAHSACEQAADDAHWPSRTRLLITLGSPHEGAPLARHGERLQQALDAFSVSAPIARIGAARSRGIKDLRGGLPATSGRWPSIEHRYIGGHLGTRPDDLLSTLFGDGLVPTASAAPAKGVLFGDAGHLSLPTDPRTWTQIREWLGV